MALQGGEVGSKEAAKLRVFFIPFFATGHIIPMTDLACLFASRPGVESTMVLTPANAALIQPTLAQFAAASSGRLVHVLLYPFPSAAVGLPSGLENFAAVPSSESYKIHEAVDLSSEAHDRLLHHHRPDAVVADIPYWWTTSIARDLGIPRITFHAVGVFPQCVMNALQRKLSEAEEEGGDVVTVPDFPGPPVRIPREELPEFLRARADIFGEAWGKMKEAQLASYGVVVNTFYEMEPEYCELYRRTDCNRAWFVGPLALIHGGGGREAAENGNLCMEWLKGKEEGSVIFICFGSWCHFSEEQLREMAVGLEASGQPFLWVVRGRNEGEGEVTEGWMPEGWEKRVEGRGLVVREWAPQVQILGHAAVGAFLTHCGWNSVLEAATVGVPVLSWPLVFEQFINERLVVEVMGTGARVWDGFRSTREEEKVVVPAEVIGRAVSRFMEEGGGGMSATRRRAREYSAMARAAVAEGGSSWNDLNRLIDELIAMRNTQPVC